MNPPPSNLSPESAPWGRYVSSEISSSLGTLSRVSADLANRGRASNSTLGTMSDQILELQARQANLVRWEDFTVDKVSMLQEVYLPAVIVPPPSESRAGVIDFTARVTHSADTVEQAIVTVSVNGELLTAGSMRILPDGGPTSPFLGDTSLITVTYGFVASPDSPVIVENAAFLLGNLDPTRTITISRSAVVQYAQRVPDEEL